MKRIIAIALCLMMLASVMAGCGKEVVSSGTTSKVSDETKEAATEAAKNENNTSKGGTFDMVLSGSYTKLSDVPAPDLSKIDTEYQNAAPQKGDVVAILHTNHGDIKMKFFPEVAPKAVNSFIALAKNGRYDNTIFHRITDPTTSGIGVVQGGDYTNYNGTGGESAYGQGFGLEVSDYLSNIEGSVAMARSNDPNSNGSQFYINYSNNNSLDGQYTVFAQVYDGMDVVNKIAKVKRDSGDKPLEDVVIKSVEITPYSE